MTAEERATWRHDRRALHVGRVSRVLSSLGVAYSVREFDEWPHHLTVLDREGGVVGRISFRPGSSNYDDWWAVRFPDQRTEVGQIRVHEEDDTYLTDLLRDLVTRVGAARPDPGDAVLGGEPVNGRPSSMEIQQ